MGTMLFKGDRFFFNLYSGYPLSYHTASAGSSKVTYGW